MLEQQSKGYQPLQEDGIAMNETRQVQQMVPYQPDQHAPYQPAPYQPAPYQPVNVPPVMVQPAPMYSTTTTTVINQQPNMKKPWSSGLCDCFDDMHSCCCVFFFGSYYVGCVSTRMGEHCCVGCGLQGLWPMRSAFRERHQIEGDLCNDCCVTTFCGPCTACQLDREMTRLGYPNGSC